MTDVKFCPSETHIQIKKGLIRRSSTKESYPMERLYVQNIVDGTVSYRAVGWLCDKCKHIEIDGVPDKE